MMNEYSMPENDMSLSLGDNCLNMSSNMMQASRMDEANHVITPQTYFLQPHTRVSQSFFDRDFFDREQLSDVYS